jgi:hypothetical protein
MKTLLLLTLTAALMCGCASTNFQSWEGRNSIMEGQGGTREVVDGVDVWTHGEPPRRFEVLGIIEDERNDALIPMAGLKRGIAQKARERGGDAVILVSSASQLRGYYTVANVNSDGFGSATSIPIRRRHSTYVVIKYLG